MQNLPESASPYIRPAEGARLTGLSPKTLAALADDGKIRFIRPGKHRRYLRSDVEALAEERAS